HARIERARARGDRHVKNDAAQSTRDGAHADLRDQGLPEGGRNSVPPSTASVKAGDPRAPDWTASAARLRGDVSPGLITDGHSKTNGCFSRKRPRNARVASGAADPGRDVRVPGYVHGTGPPQWSRETVSRVGRRPLPPQRAPSGRDPSREP